ncbi:hypothetical protein B0H11DRAFT_1713618 [Mycena galericulata]|nr:hypothetical protein B0H11DRAFT_1713618 [Mycena galericulata]
MTHVKVFVSGIVKRNDRGETLACAGIFYQTGDPRNRAIQLPVKSCQTVPGAEAHAVLLCIKQNDPQTSMTIYSKRNFIRNAMTSQLPKWEDRGWIGVAEKLPLKALAAELKARTAKTFFVTLEDSENYTTTEREGCHQAHLLALEGQRNETSDQIDIQVQDNLKLKGAKLSTLTQALAYSGIKALKAKASRPATDEKIKQVQTAIHHNHRRIPTPAQIWKSIRHKDFSRQIRNFLWKSMHNAHRIGKYWKHIPECEEWGTCQSCGEIEDLEHILLKCERPGQELIWKLAETLWLKKNSHWPELSLGSILGCGLTSITDEKGNYLPGASRLYRIIISESLYMIWKIRCDCVIGKGGQSLSNSEIHNKWLHAINECLKFDCILTNHSRYGKNVSIKPILVLQTWSSTLKNEEDLPENWLKEPKVLVGIEPMRSPPPSQPADRPGRNR